MEMAAVHSSWDIHLTLRDLFCFFFALVAIWLKLHIIGFAYSIIKSIVLQKNALSYDFLFQLLPFPWKEIGPFTRWIVLCFSPFSFLLCLKDKCILHSFWKSLQVFHGAFYKGFSLVVCRLRYFTGVCLLLHFLILETVLSVALVLDRGGSSNHGFDQCAFRI